MGAGSSQGWLKIKIWIDKVADRAGDLIREGRSSGRSSGRARSLPDAIIAATALENHLTLVTFNVVDFAGIPGLSLFPLMEGT